MPNGLFRRPTWRHSIHQKLDPFSASQEATRELRLTLMCDESALSGPERDAFTLLRHLAQDKAIEWHDWNTRPPKWTLNEEGDCYTFQCFDHLGRLHSTALSDWIRRPMTDSEVTVMAHDRFGHDLLVTTDPLLLQLSDSTDNANILTPSLALPLTHLYLRSRGHFIYDVGENGQATFNRGLFYLVQLRSLLPELWPFMRAAAKQDSSSTGLCAAIRIRCIRALQAQDELGWLFFGQRDSSDDRDRMAYHFEYVTLLLSGAIDAQARILRHVYSIPVKPKYASFKNESFLKRLRAAGAVAICDLVEHGVHDDLLVTLRTIRNKIHADPLGDMGYSSPATGDIGLLTLGGDDAQIVLQRVRALGNADEMGIFPFDHPRILIEPFRCASFLLLHTFRLIAAISQTTDFGALANDPEHPAALDLFRERTLNNMKLFCRPVAVL